MVSAVCLPPFWIWIVTIIHSIVSDKDLIQVFFPHRDTWYAKSITAIRNTMVYVRLYYVDEQLRGAR
ncbi:hypothetical protein SDJN02_03810, partial [Cucurbita argyrosperma subsp. argyrosperma]